MLEKYKLQSKKLSKQTVHVAEAAWHFSNFVFLVVKC